MIPMNRQTHNKTLEVGLRQVLFQSFREKPEMWKQAFRMDTIDRASISDVAFTDFGPMQEGSEMGGYTYDAGTQGPTTTYTPSKYVKAFSLSEEVQEDDQNGLMRKYPAAMGRSIRHTLEATHWTHFNNGFDSNYPGADGKSFFATDHVLYGPGGGSQANKLSVAANLSATAIEQAMTDIMLTTDDRGKFINLQPKKIYVPAQLWGEARRIFGTSGEVGTGNNTINVVAGKLEVAVIPFLTSTKAWFIECDTHELWHIWRKRITTGQENDWDTDVFKFKAKGRWTSGWTAPWGWFASEGV